VTRFAFFPTPRLALKKGARLNTLVFAYAGAALPVLLIFSIGGTSFTDAVNSDPWPRRSSPR
jgi:hypothetical protein